MVYRVFVEKKSGLDNEAKALLHEARSLLGITALTDVRLLNRYDGENITEELFDYAVLYPNKNTHENLIAQAKKHIKKIKN